jgi:hypothetical protein
MTLGKNTANRFLHMPPQTPVSYHGFDIPGTVAGFYGTLTD